MNSPPPSSVPIQITEVDSRTMGGIAAVMGQEGDLAVTRLARGCRCFAAWRQGELAGYGWVSTQAEWIGEIQVELEPGPSEAYIWNCVTVPEHRRRGVFGALLLGITEWGRAAGLSRLWIGSVAIPAEKAVRPAGFKPALEFASETVGDLHWLRVRPAEGADSALVEAALRALSVHPGAVLRRSHLRRH